MVVPFVLIPITVISLTGITYGQLVLRDSAIEGARFAALADQDSESGCMRSLELAKRAFAGFTELKASCLSSSQGEFQIERVNLSGKVPVMGLIPFSPRLSASASAPREN